MLISSKDVAQLAGVSPSTVSRVARGGAGVTRELRERVLRVFAETGFRPQAAAGADSRPALLLVTRGWCQADGRLIDALADAADAAGAVLSVARDDAALPLHPAFRGADGLIVEDPAAARRLRESAPHLPLVALACGDSDGIDCVGPDDHDAGQRVAAYIAGSARGQVALVGDLGPASPAAPRVAGFRDGALLHDLVLPAYRQLDCGAVAAAAEAAVAGLLRTALGYPQAFYCTGDATALGVLRAVRGLGWLVPQDVWVIGHGDCPFADASACDLTSVSPAFSRIAGAAVDRVLARLRDPAAAPATQRIPCSLVARGTTAGMAPPPRPGDDEGPDPSAAVASDVGLRP